MMKLPFCLPSVLPTGILVALVVMVAGCSSEQKPAECWQRRDEDGRGRFQASGRRTRRSQTSHSSSPIWSSPSLHPRSKNSTRRPSGKTGRCSTAWTCCESNKNPSNRRRFPSPKRSSCETHPTSRTKDSQFARPRCQAGWQQHRLRTDVGPPRVGRSQEFEPDSPQQHHRIRIPDDDGLQRYWPALERSASQLLCARRQRSSRGNRAKTTRWTRSCCATTSRGPTANRSRPMTSSSRSK